MGGLKEKNRMRDTLQVMQLGEWLVDNAEGIVGVGASSIELSASFDLVNGTTSVSIYKESHDALIVGEEG